MNRPRVVDLDTRRALRRDVETLVAEHAELAHERGRERCLAWLSEDAPEDTAEEGDPPLSE